MFVLPSENLESDKRIQSLEGLQPEGRFVTRDSRVVIRYRSFLVCTHCEFQLGLSTGVEWHNSGGQFSPEAEEWNDTVG